MRKASLSIPVALLALSPHAEAAFHLWEVEEVYSNGDGSIQFIELFSSFAGQTALNGQDVVATSDGVDRTFTFDRNLVGSTVGAHLLLATPEFGSLPGAVAPDFILPCGPFFDPAAVGDITIDFVGADSVTLAAGTLPTDGEDSLTDTNLGGVPNFVAAVNSPTNFGGDAGDLGLSACEADGSCDLCDDGDFCNGVESCVGSACAAGEDPCAGVFCDEAANECVECLVDGDCDDGDVCTDDSCAAGVCARADNAAPCDDDLFCTQTDACAEGLCVGSGETCGKVNCNEGTDLCGDCVDDAECEDGSPCTLDDCDAGACVAADAADGTPCPDDGLFCTGEEACRAGLCAGAGDPCDPERETCVETDDRCVRCGDGRLDLAEACDDGDVEDGDGCSSACDVEDGFTCDVSVEPSVCAPVPGEDAGPDEDAGGGEDAGPSDAGGGGDRHAEGGCDCRTGPRGSGAAWLLGLALLGAARMRRSRRLAR